MAGRNVPWNAVCLPQAMAAKAMLARRGCGSSFRLGADFDAQGRIIAHAWLVAGGTIVVGAAGVGRRDTAGALRLMAELADKIAALMPHAEGNPAAIMDRAGDGRGHAQMTRVSGFRRAL